MKNEQNLSDERLLNEAVSKLNENEHCAGSGDKMEEIRSSRRKRRKNTNEGTPEWNLVASWKYEYIADMPDDFSLEDAAVILQNTAQKLCEILEELPELPSSKPDETCMKNLGGKARWVRLKAHVVQIMIKSIREREKRISKFGG